MTNLSAPAPNRPEVERFLFARSVPEAKLDFESGRHWIQTSGAVLQSGLSRHWKRNGGPFWRFDDDSSPEAIREAFWFAAKKKKRSTQALGCAFYKSRRIQFNKPGIQLLDNTT